jgi:hypothetical protein
MSLALVCCGRLGQQGRCRCSWAKSLTFRAARELRWQPGPPPPLCPRAAPANGPPLQRSHCGKQAQPLRALALRAAAKRKQSIPRSKLPARRSLPDPRRPSQLPHGVAMPTFGHFAPLATLARRTFRECSSTCSRYLVIVSFEIDSKSIEISIWAPHSACAPNGVPFPRDAVRSAARFDACTVGRGGEPEGGCVREPDGNGEGCRAASVWPCSALTGTGAGEDSERIVFGAILA